MDLPSFYQPTPEQSSVRDAILKICENFGDSYWLRKDTEKAFPHEFYKAIAEGGWVGIAVPEQYGGAGLGVSGASTCLQTIAECGGGMNGGTSFKVNIFGLYPLVKFGTEQQKQRIIPPIIEGREKLCFAITEPDVGLDTRHLRTFARRAGDGYVIDGKKVWISTAQEADRMLIMARTTPLSEVSDPNEGLSLFLTKVDRKYVTVREIPKLGRSAIDANEMFIEGLPVSSDDLVGEESKGLRYVFQSMNSERITSAAEAVGIGRAALKRAAQYANDRRVFDRPIGKNQGVQHPLAQCWMELETANLLVFRAAQLFDDEQSCGLAANTAKYLAVEAGVKACETAMLTHGGMGYAREFHVERYLRDIMLIRIAPVTPQLILSYVAERALGLPKSY